MKKLIFIGIFLVAFSAVFTLAVECAPNQITDCDELTVGQCEDFRLVGSSINCIVSGSNCIEGPGGCTGGDNINDPLFCAGEAVTCSDAVTDPTCQVLDDRRFEEVSPNNFALCQFFSPNICNPSGATCALLEEESVEAVPEVSYNTTNIVILIAVVLIGGAFLIKKK